MRIKDEIHACLSLKHLAFLETLCAFHTFKEQYSVPNYLLTMLTSMIPHDGSFCLFVQLFYECATSYREVVWFYCMQLKYFCVLFQDGGLLMWMKSRAGFQQLILRMRMAIQMSLKISHFNQEVTFVYYYTFGCTLYQAIVPEHNLCSYHK